MKYLFSHERDTLPSDVSLPGGSVVNNLSANAGDVRERHGFHLWVGKTPLEEEIALSILAWGIPWSEEPGGLQTIGWQRVRHL